MKNLNSTNFYHFFLSLFVLFCTQTQAQTLTARPNVSMTSGSNGYYEFLPSGYNAFSSQKYPLLIACGGLSQNGNGTAAQLDGVFSNWGGPGWQIVNGKFPSSFVVNGQTFRFIVILPQFTNGASVVDIDHVITYLIAHYNVDPNRVYLTGNSSGGGYCWNYPGAGVQYGQRLAAVIPTCAAAGYNSQKAQNIAAANLPVWATHNAIDPTVSPNTTRSFVNGINSAPNPPTPRARMTIFQDNSHNCADSTFNPVSGVHTANGLNIYQWLLTNTRANTALAVTGLEFSALKKSNNKVELTWNTLAEINNLGFEIQRSADGIRFDRIGYLASTSIDGNGASYAFTDLTPLRGKNYYRLQQIDINYSMQLSPIKIVQLQSGNIVRAYPNPVTDILAIYTGEVITNGQLKIINMSGAIVKTAVLNGVSLIKTPVKGLPPGLYSAELHNASLISRFSFIKQ